MKVIFLDIDGVLNSRIYDRKRNWNENTDIDESRLPVLKSIVDKTEAVIVLSSSWRTDWNENPALCGEDGKYINETLAKAGLKVYSKTPDYGLRGERKDEIIGWLTSCKEDIESFVILDDYAFGWDELFSNFVKTNPNFGLGLEEEHAEKAVKILNGKTK